MRRAGVYKLRLHTAEREAWEAKAAAAGLELAAFIRAAVTRSRVVNREDQRRLLFHIAKIGNNINQIARFANAHKQGAEAAQVVAALLGVQRALAGLHTGVHTPAGCTHGGDDGEQ